MRIGLLSDTHIWSDSKKLPPEINEVFQGVDLILHGGDIYRSSVLDQLENLAPTLAARGDDDFIKVNGRVKEKHCLELEGILIWLIHIVPFNHLHSLVYSRSYSPSTTFISMQKSELLGGRVTQDSPHILIFGDTHQPFLGIFEDMLCINPGSATCPNHYEFGALGTVAILTLDSDKVETQIIQL
jgi:hypothetical protein